MFDFFGYRRRAVELRQREAAERAARDQRRATTTPLTTLPRDAGPYHTLDAMNVPLSFPVHARVPSYDVGPVCSASSDGGSSGSSSSPSGDC